MKKNIFWGLTFIAIAALIVFGAMFPIINSHFFVFLLMAFCAINIIYWMTKLQFVFPALCFALGLTLVEKVADPWYELVGIPEIATGTLFTVSLLVGIGLTMIFSGPRKKMKQKRHVEFSHHGRTWTFSTDGPVPVFTRGDDDEIIDIDGEVIDDEIHYSKNSDWDSSQFINVEVSMGDTTRIVQSKNFKGGNIEVSLGQATIDLTNAQLDHTGAVLNVEVSLGGIELRIPRGWSVENRVKVALGGISDDRKDYFDETEPKLILVGDVSLGGMDILYV